MNKGIKYITSCRLPIEWGIFTMYRFEEANGQKHTALSMGDFSNGLSVLSRTHSERLTGDALFSQKYDCGPQLKTTMQAVQEEERGIIACLRQEGRGIDLINKVRAYRLQDQGLNTVEANLKLGLPMDAHDFSLAKHIYDHLSAREIKLLTNNPEKVSTLQQAGISIVEHILLQVGENSKDRRYLHTKAEKSGYLLFPEQQ